MRTAHATTLRSLTLHVEVIVTHVAYLYCDQYVHYTTLMV